MATTTVRDTQAAAWGASALRRLSSLWARVRWDLVSEWLIIAIVGTLYSGPALLDFDRTLLQQTGEHNESATLPLLAEIGLRRYGEIPLWNPYMLTGFPHAGDIINHFWNPVSTLSILVWGGINGMKVSIFLSFLLAGLGQWVFAHVFGARGALRLWAGLMFMTSGGLALLWRTGWYELLLGAAWFPWCFASLWVALHQRSRRSVVLAAACVAMLLSTGGGYYPLYLFGMLSVLLAMALIVARPGERWPQVRAALAVAGLSAGLLAVVMLPVIDGYRYTGREASPDREQQGSQSITYALVNYVVSEPAWLHTNILGNQSGWNWFYIGAVPVAALALAPLALRRREGRVLLVVPAVLLLFILAWHANRTGLFRYIYDTLPLLYTWRFPGRLLILATSPLLLVAALALQHLFGEARDQMREFTITITGRGEWDALARQGQGAALKLPAHWLPEALLVLLLLFSLREAFDVNRGFAFRPGRIDPKSTAALTWLKRYDPSLYYIHVGSPHILWSWTPAAYDLEMPVINFKYNRLLRNFDAQRAEGAPFYATAKYLLAVPDQAPPGGVLLADFDGMSVWHMPDAMPFAFDVPVGLPLSGSPIGPQDVSPLAVSFDGPNRVVVTGAGDPARQLVVLVSDYPGWQLFVDGQAAPVAPVNGYLGAQMLAGDHSYVFVFKPAQHYAGLTISVLTALLMVGLLWYRPKASRQAKADSGAASAHES